MGGKEAALAAARGIFTTALLEVLVADPREAAERAYVWKVTPSVEVLEARIRDLQSRNRDEASEQELAAA